MNKCPDFKSCIESEPVDCEIKCREFGIDNRPIALVKDPKSTCIYFRNNNRQICCYKLDQNHVVTNQFSNENICDKLLLILDGDKQAVFIELKGKNIEKAILQITQSVNLLKNDLENFKIHCRIVSTRVPKIEAKSFIKFKLQFKREYHGTCELRENRFVEDIAKFIGT